MAKFTFMGLEEYEKQLSTLQEFKTVRGICGAVVYEGAKVMADAIKGSIESLPVVDHRAHGTEKNKLSGITSAQKKGLIEGFGVSKMQYESGYFNVKLGFDGYNTVKTKKYPNGQPNALIARSINSGTSFREKTQFVDKTVRRTRKATEDAMKETFDEKFEKIAKGR